VQYMQDFQTNFVIALTVIFTLGIGSILPIFILHKSSYTLSRRKFKDS
jgi:putative membrane protein